MAHWRHNPQQTVELFFFATAACLTVAWGVAIYFLIPKQQPVQVRAKKRGEQ